MLGSDRKRLPNWGLEESSLSAILEWLILTSSTSPHGWQIADQTARAHSYILQGLTKDNSVFGRRTSTASGLFESSGSVLVETLGYIVFIREKKLSNTNLLASGHIKTEKTSLPVDVCRSKKSLGSSSNSVFERQASIASGFLQIC